MRLDSIILVLTTSCNLNCSYCYEKTKHKEIMPLDIIDKSLELLYEHTTEKVFSVALFGGEPMLAFDEIMYTLEKVKRPYSISISTNGTIWNDRLNSVLKDENIFIHFSMDGIGLEKCGQRGKEVKESVILQNLKKVLSIAPQKMRIRMNLTEGNVCFLADHFYEYAKLGVPTIDLIPRQFYDTDVFKDPLILEIYKEQLKKIAVIAKYFKIRSNLLNAETHRWGSYGCSPDKLRLSIMPDGDIYPCSTFYFMAPKPEKYKLGNLFTGFTTKPDMYLQTFPKEQCKTCSVSKCELCMSRFTGKTCEMCEYDKVNKLYSF